MLCRRDRAPIEGSDSSCKCIHKAIQLFIGKSAVDVPVLCRGIAVEVVGAKDDFERAAAADQRREALGAAPVLCDERGRAGRAGSSPSSKNDKISLLREQAGGQV